MITFKTRVKELIKARKKIRMEGFGFFEILVCSQSGTLG
jgi:hypothetical protein